MKRLPPSHKESSACSAAHRRRCGRYRTDNILNKLRRRTFIALRRSSLYGDMRYLCLNIHGDAAGKRRAVLEPAAEEEHLASRAG